MAYAYLEKGSKIMLMHCRTGYNLFTLYKRRNKTPMLLSLIIHCVSERLHTFSVVFEPKTSTRGDTKLQDYECDLGMCSAGTLGSYGVHSDLSPLFVPSVLH